MPDRVPSARHPFLEPRDVRSAATASPMGAVLNAAPQPPVALLAELAWAFDWQRLADELRILTPDERSAVLRMAEDLAEEVEKSMKGDR